MSSLTRQQPYRKERSMAPMIPESILQARVLHVPDRFEPPAKVVSR